MNFLRTFLSGFTNLSAYVLFLQLRFIKTLQYFLIFYFSMFLIFFGVTFLTFRSVSSILISSFPNDLTLNYSNGTMNANTIALPFTIPVEQLATITVHTESIEIRIEEQSNTIPYTEFIPKETVFSLDKNSLTTFFSQFSPLVLSFISFIAFLALFLSRVFEVFFYAFLLYNVLFFLKKKILYKKALQIIMGMFPTAETINVLYLFLYRSFGFPMFDLVLLVLIVLLLRQQTTMHQPRNG